MHFCTFLCAAHVNSFIVSTANRQQKLFDSKGKKCVWLNPSARQTKGTEILIGSRIFRVFSMYSFVAGFSLSPSVFLALSLSFAVALCLALARKLLNATPMMNIGDRCACDCLFRNKQPN